jgi:hypothetical protein
MTTPDIFRHPRKAVLCAIGATIVMSLLAACSYHFQIIVKDVDSGYPMFTFEKPSATSLGTRDLIELTTFLVVEQKTDDYKHPIWAFELEPGTSLELRQVRYGTVPKGFTETSKARTLEPRTKYVAVGFGPGSSGSQEFEFGR